LGYRVKAGLFSAEEVGGTHRRQRLFILAYANSEQYDWLRHLREKRRTQPTDSRGKVGNSDRKRQSQQIVLEQESGRWPSDSIKNVGNPYSARLERRSEPKLESPHQLFAWPPSSEERALWKRAKPEWLPATESNFRRMADGYADAMEPTRHRTHRLRALGNAVVPLVAAYAFNTLLDD
jgi:DNA (cytosine-5)-methyltransferase 1